MFGRPFEAARADYRVSRCDGCISTGRVGRRSSPRGPAGSSGDRFRRSRFRELFSEVVVPCFPLLVLP